MSPSISKTTQALLGFLSWGPMSGYDLKKVIDGSIRNFWSESYGQIYPMLDRLRKAGLVDCQEETSPGGRKRKVYSLTAAGGRELDDWLALPHLRQPPRNELLLKLFFGSRLPLEQVRSHLEAYREEIAEDLERYAEIRRNLEPARDAGQLRAPHFWLMTLRQGELNAEAMLRWCDECLAELASMELADSSHEDAPDEGEPR